MIIDGYVVPDDLEIEEFTTKKGYTLYACGSNVSPSKELVIALFATGRVCKECGAITKRSPYHTLCFACENKVKRERYLKIPVVSFTGQPVFVGDDFTTDLEQYLIDQLDDCSLDEILTFEIMEAELMKVPDFNMSEFFEWHDYQYEDMEVYRGYDKAISVLIAAAAEPVYTYGKNRVEIPEWLVKKLKEAQGGETAH